MRIGVLGKGRAGADGDRAEDDREKGETGNEENKISTSVSLGSHVCKLSQWEKVDAYVTIWILVFKILSATVGYSLLIISLTPCTVTSIPDVKNSMSFCSLNTV